MASISAELVAKDVIKTIIKGEKPIVAKIAMKHGYSKASAISNKAQNTLTYQRTIGMYLKRIEKHRDKVLKAMENKDLNLEDYKTLSEALDRLSKQSLLLNGKSTDNVAVSVQVIDYSNSDV